MTGNTLERKPAHRPAANPLWRWCGWWGVSKCASPLSYYGGNSRAHNKTCETIFSAIPPAEKFPFF